MGKIIHPERSNWGDGAAFSRIYEEWRQIQTCELTDLLPDAPQTEDYQAWKAWHRECTQGPITPLRLLEAYSRGYSRALKEAK